MTQEQINHEGNFPVGTSSEHLDIQEELAAAGNVLGKTLVTHGANQDYFEGIVDKTVGEIKKDLREVFNIPGDAIALIGAVGSKSSSEVGDEHVIAQGEWLEFTKDAGTKGQ